jgi:hypothetical protein
MGATCRQSLGAQPGGRLYFLFHENPDTLFPGPVGPGWQLIAFAQHCQCPNHGYCARQPARCEDRAGPALCQRGAVPRPAHRLLAGEGRANGGKWHLRPRKASRRPVHAARIGARLRPPAAPPDAVGCYAGSAAWHVAAGPERHPPGGGDGAGRKSRRSRQP